MGREWEVEGVHEEVEGRYIVRGEESAWERRWRERKWRERVERG